VYITNAYGSAWSSVATIKVLPLPVIAQQPPVTIVTVSNQFILPVGVTGIGPFAYQWLKDGVMLPGAVFSNYTNNCAQYTDAGQYSVLVANSYGAVQSQSAIVLVLPTQPLIIPKNDGTPIILQLVMNQDNSTAVVFYGAVGSNYVVQASSDLANWQPLSVVQAKYNLNAFIDQQATNLPARFYQVQLLH
jgi:hypothetical protein